MNPRYQAFLNSLQSPAEESNARFMAFIVRELSLFRREHNYSGPLNDTWQRRFTAWLLAKYPGKETLTDAHV